MRVVKGALLWGVLSVCVLTCVIGITQPDQLQKLQLFKQMMVTRSKNWEMALEEWVCPTNPADSDSTCDPCSRDFTGNWKHMHCRGPTNGSGESSQGIYDGFVTNIHITDVKLDGPVPRELCMFSHIRELDLDGGHLTGPFPEWIVECLPQLAEFDMSYNRLSGTLPKSIATVRNLQEIKVEYNQFSGPIPSEYGYMKHLRVLRLESNRITGRLPDSLALTNRTLTTLELGQNDLEGDLRVLGPCKLMIVTLYNNPKLCGMVPASVRYAKAYNPYGTNLGKPCGK